MSVSVEAFKRALANLAGGVVIVTTSDEEGVARGMTATAVCSVSVDPPLVMACMDQGAATHRAVRAAGVFALNLLPARAEKLAARFASNRADKFEGLETSIGDTGAPILADAFAFCDCVVEKTVDAGDHTIFIGRVLGAGHFENDARSPLLYFRGDYGTVAPIDHVRGRRSGEDADPSADATEDDAEA